MIKPNFVIGTPDNPYMLRWYLIPRNPIFNVYLHKFLRHDDDRALHDHPWWFLSVVLKGTYREVLRDGIESSWRKRFSFALRKPTYQHRVVLREDEGKPLPCWTLVLTGPRIREWGFWCPQGFVHWKVFTRPGDKGQVGRGCE